MPTHVALLRGINLGAHSRVAMADLRRVVTSLGHTEVATYIQSGNAVFTTQETDSVALAAGLEAAIAEGLDVHPSVVVLSRAELARVIADNPFPDERNPKHLHAVLRGDDPDAQTLAWHHRGPATGHREGQATVTKLLALLDASSAVLVYGADSRSSST